MMEVVVVGEVEVEVEEGEQLVLQVR